MPEESLRLDVNEQIECAHTLASRFYIDPAILEIEKEKIFRRTWQLVGTLSQPCGEMNGAKRTIADPETFFTAEVTGEPIVIVRDKEGTLRAFSNVCRHRAGQRLQECLALRLPRLDVYARWAAHWHARCGRRGVLRPQHHGHGAAAAGDLGTVHLRQF